MLDILLDRGEELGRPEGAAACYGAPFAGDVVFFDVGFDGVDVFNFEGGNGGGAIEEEGLAVASVAFWRELDGVVCWWFE